jgi:hypothetical protein
MVDQPRIFVAGSALVLRVKYHWRNPKAFPDCSMCDENNRPILPAVICRFGRCRPSRGGSSHCVEIHCPQLLRKAVGASHESI